MIFHSSLSSTQKLWILIFMSLVACVLVAGPLWDILVALSQGETLEEALVAFGYAPSPIPTPIPPTLQVDVTACLEGNDLVIKIQFDRPLTGQGQLWVYSGGGSDFLTQPDATGFQEETNYFSEFEDFRSAVDRWEVSNPTSSNPNGISIAGTFLLIPLGGEASTLDLVFVEFSMDVLECNPIEPLPPTVTPSPTPNPDGTPAILNSQCLSPQQLMIVFEFQQPVTGLYELFVNGAPYQIAPVPDQPNRLFFFGAAPPGGGMPTIVMRTLPDQVVVLEVTDYSVPQCDFQSPSNPGGGGDDYVPPPLP